MTIKRIFSVLFLICAAGASAADSAAPPSPWAYSAAAVSDYLFRGISQTHGQPALQGAASYTHASGAYVSLAASTITWVKDWAGKGSLEVDAAAGYKNAIAASKFGYDVGYMTYNYPGGDSNPAVGGIEKPATQELYGGLSYDLGNNNSLSAKYSFVTSKYFVGWFGVDAAGNELKTQGSGYFEVNGSFDVGNGWGIAAHAGHQTVKNLSVASYSDINLGVTKAFGFGTLGLLVSTTNARGDCSGSGAQPYCWGAGGSSSQAPDSHFRNVGKTQGVVSFAKTF